MNSEEAKARAMENARQPIRDEVYSLIESKVNYHENVNNGDFSVMFVLPRSYKYAVKEDEKRKTVNGEEKILTTRSIVCEDVEWLIKELKAKRYNAELRVDEGYFYNSLCVYITTKL